MENIGASKYFAHVIDNASFHLCSAYCNRLFEQTDNWLQIYK